MKSPVVPPSGGVPSFQRGIRSCGGSCGAICGGNCNGGLDEFTGIGAHGRSRFREAGRRLVLEFRLKDLRCGSMLP